MALLLFQPSSVFQILVFFESKLVSKIPINYCLVMLVDNIMTEGQLYFYNYFLLKILFFLIPHV